MARPSFRIVRRWLEQVLAEKPYVWKIVFMHHPLYAVGSRHGAEDNLRNLVEPIFVKQGVSTVFSGHEHIYARTKPQQGITYFVEGASGQLLTGGYTPSAITAAGFDQDRSFMIVSIKGRELSFRVITRTGQEVDRGTIVARQPAQ
jgi:3',5'-cyclic AMP phosphodiesterase CpdA